MKNLLVGLLFLILGQVGAWFQQFAQMKWPWFKENTWFTAVVLGVPLSYFFILGARYVYDEVGSAWSARLFQFSIGIIVMMLLTQFLLKETMSIKNVISLSLSLVIVLIQLVWK